MTKEEAEKVNLALFDKSDPVQLQDKVVMGFGAFCGMRGNKEHAAMTFDQVATGVFPSNHPMYPKEEWWGLKNFGPTDKKHKLSLANGFLRNLNGNVVCCFPVKLDGKTGNVANDFGGAIKHYVESFPLEERKGCLYRKVKSDKSGYCKSAVIGKHTITKKIRDVYRICGIRHWAKLHPHALRNYFITLLANDDSISKAERIKAS